MVFSPDREKYAALGAARADWPVFMRPWWLGAVCSDGGEWGSRVALGGDGRPVAATPFFLQKKWGVSKLGLPPFTPWLGLWLEAAPPGGNRQSALSRERQAVCGLLASLPRADLFDVNFQPGFAAGLSAQMAGFKESTRHTFIMDNLSGEGGAAPGFNRNTRRASQKSSGLLETAPSTDLAALFFLSKKTFSRRGAGLPFSIKLLENVDAALEKHYARQLLLAKNRAGEPVAAAYFCWGGGRADLLASAADPGFREAGAGVAVLAGAVGFLKGKTQNFDLNGSMDEGVATVFRGLGGRAMGYPRFTRGRNRWFDALQSFSK